MYGKKLGEGGFGTVYEGTVAGQPVALKQLTSSHARVHENFRKELDVMCKLRHPNIVLLLGAVIQPDQLCLVMEICQGSPIPPLLPLLSLLPFFLSFFLSFFSITLSLPSLSSPFPLLPSSLLFFTLSFPFFPLPIFLLRPPSLFLYLSPSHFPRSLRCGRDPPLPLIQFPSILLYYFPSAPFIAILYSLKDSCISHPLPRIITTLPPIPSISSISPNFPYFSYFPVFPQYSQFPEYPK